MNKRKEVFGFRKSKVAKTLCGAVLGAALIAVADQQALADEDEQQLISPLARQNRE